MNTYKKFEELLTWADKTTYQIAKATGISAAALQGKIGKFAVNVQKTRKYNKNFDTSKLEKQLERLNDVYIMGNISSADYQKKTAEIKRKIEEAKRPNTAPTIPAEVSEMLSDKSFADIYNSLSDKEKFAL